MKESSRQYGTGENDITGWFFKQPNGYFGEFDEIGEYICNFNLTESDVFERGEEYYNEIERRMLLKEAVDELPLPIEFSHAEFSGSRFDIAIKRHEISEGKNEAINLLFAIRKDEDKSEIEDLIYQKNKLGIDCSGFYRLFLGNKEFHLSVCAKDQDITFAWSCNVQKLNQLFGDNGY